MIYRSSPVGIERIWGSLPGPGDVPVGERWWLYQTGGESSRLKPLGTGRPTNVASLAALCGFEEGFPVIVKTLHTAGVLSVQVHPGRTGGPLRKDETWIVLSAESTAWMLGGLDLRPGDRLGDRISAGTVGSALRTIPLVPGDVFHIPPGTVHALGPGLEILEVQDSCDVTYRLYDWGRTGADGCPRDLHLNQALASIGPLPGPDPVRIGVRGEIDPEADTGGGYSIRSIGGEGKLPLTGGASIFLTGGHLSCGGESIMAPACVVSDPIGGETELSEGSGYIITPGGR